MINKKVTFKDFDKLSLKPFAENLLQIMEKGIDSSIGDVGEKGSYTISLNAEFGNGKTTFLKMFEHFINEEKSNYVVVFTNAWESDFYGEPVIAILSEFVNWLEQQAQAQELEKEPEQQGQTQQQGSEVTLKSKEINQSETKYVNHREQKQPIKTQKTNQKQENSIEKENTNPTSNDYHSRNDCHSRESGNPEKQHIVSTKIKEVIGTLARYKIVKAGGILANQIIQSKFGIDMEKLKDHLTCKNKKDTQKTDQNKSLGKNVLEEFNQRKEAIKQIKHIISEYFNKDKKLLIIVDELDRTRPDYAVHFLEDMKHFFDIKNVVFLMAVNRQQMEATVKCLYGQGLNFEGYYRKFFKQEMNLPDPYKEAQRLVDSLIQKTSVKYNPQTNDRSYRVSNSYLSCRMFGLTLREVEQFVRIFEMILGDEKHSERWVYQDAYSFFICLYMKEKKIFRKILNGQFTVDNFIQFIDNKNFDYKLNQAKEDRPSISDNSIIYNNNILIGHIACSFVTHQSREKNVQKIQNAGFRIGLNGNNPFVTHVMTLTEFDQPAVKICEKINQCKSAFKN